MHLLVLAGITAVGGGLLWWVARAGDRRLYIEEED